QVVRVLNVQDGHKLQLDVPRSWVEEHHRALLADHQDALASHPRRGRATERALTYPVLVAAAAVDGSLRVFAAGEDRVLRQQQALRMPGPVAQLAVDVGVTLCLLDAPLRFAGAGVECPGLAVADAEVDPLAVTGGRTTADPGQLLAPPDRT